MSASESIARFIERNNAILDEVLDLLDEATAPAGSRLQRDRALATAGHLACRQLQRLYKADELLWTPLKEQHRLRLDDGLVIHIQRVDPQEPLRAPVTLELLELLGCRRIERARDLINKGNQMLEEVFRFRGAGGLESLVADAKHAIGVLRDETCPLVGSRGRRWKLAQLLRAIAIVVASANLEAAAKELGNLVWEEAPELLEQVGHLLQQAGATIDSLVLVRGFAMCVIIQETMAVIQSVRTSEPTISDTDARVLDAIRLLSERTSRITLREISKATGYSISTVHRSVRSLDMLGLIWREQVGHLSYVIGPAD